MKKARPVYFALIERRHARVTLVVPAQSQRRLGTAAPRHDQFRSINDHTFKGGLANEDEESSNF